MTNNNAKQTVGKLRRMIQDEKSRSYYIFSDVIAVVILVSVFAIILESVKILNVTYGSIFLAIDIIVTGIFLIEYILRIVYAEKPFKYIISPLGIIDLLSFIPSLLLFAFPVFTDLHSLRVLRVIRIIRLLRLFRILKILAYTRRRQSKSRIIRSLTSADIQIYIFTLLSVTVIAGTLMYLAESDVPGSALTNIPQGMWWAIVTITTVGYGDIVPVTVTGKIIAAFTMVSGLTLFALLITVMGKVAQITLFGSPIEDEEKLLKPKKKKKP